MAWYHRPHDSHMLQNLHLCPGRAALCMCTMHTYDIFVNICARMFSKEDGTVVVGCHLHGGGDTTTHTFSISRHMM